MEKSAFREAPNTIVEKTESRDTKLLNCGVWVENLQDNQDLPKGWNMFTKKVTDYLKLDFSSFDEAALTEFTPENFKSLFESRKEKLAAWLQQAGLNVDPYLHFVARRVQVKITELLDIQSPDKDPTAQQEKNRSEMSRASSEKRAANLSDFKEKSMCSERAALGQYLLQRVGLKSAYLGGAIMADARDDEEYASHHAFLVLEHNNETFIFDIARPYPSQKTPNIPRILKTDVPLTYELLKGRQEMLVGATEPSKSGERIWYGISEGDSGPHDFIEKPVVEKKD